MTERYYGSMSQDEVSCKVRKFHTLIKEGRREEAAVKADQDNEDFVNALKILIMSV